MKTFINSSSVKNDNEKIDITKIELFIDKFNESIKKGDFVINDSLDNFSKLNQKEFLYTEKLAKKQGWKLTQVEDNYQSISYKISKIIAK